MDGRVPGSRRRLPVAAGVALLLLACATAMAAPRIEIVSTSDTSFTYRELVPMRVAADAATGVYHAASCPDARPAMERIAPAAATLRGLKPHACVASAKPEYATRTEARKPRDPKRISVLFIGNSLVFYNQIPATTEAIAAREARPLRVDAITLSGATLDQLWNDTAARKRLWQERWDYVVLQGGAGSAGPLRNAANFNRYLQLWVDDVRRSGATPLMYMVWSLERPEEHERASVAAAKRVGAKLVPVGFAWNELLRRKRFARLDWDGVHPDAFGAYLVACTVYSTVYGKPAHGAPFSFRHLAARNEVYDEALRKQTLTAEDARAIQDAAWRSVR